MNTNHDSVFLYDNICDNTTDEKNDMRASVLQVLVFCFVDLLATDFLLAAIVTYAVSKGLSIVRF